MLLRFYLRVDDVLLRINDTRVYYEVEKGYVLREYTSRESRTKDLKVIDFQFGDVHFFECAEFFLGASRVLGRSK